MDGAVAGCAPARVLVVALDGDAAAHWRGIAGAIERAPDLRHLAQRGGSCLALAAFGASARGSRVDGSGVAAPAPAFAISVGDAVRRGLPTAARATITGAAPLRRGIVEAPFGGGLARALVQSTDVLLVFGAPPGSRERWRVRVDARGGVELDRVQLDPGATTGQRAKAWTANGEHVLVVGPAAEAGLPFANLGSWDPGGGAPSLVGRGGLGRTVASAGVVAISVAGCESGREPTASGPELTRALESSPRLVARAIGGTLELGEVRGDARGAAGDGAAGPRTRHGCQGCPTPCGWQFETRGGAADGELPKVGGRYAALQGFLRQGGRAAALEALSRCNDLGIDARSAALVLGEDPFTGAAPDPGDLLDSSKAAHGRAMSLTPEADHEPGTPLMPADLAGEVGVRLGARGPEPLRSLSVLGLRASGTVDAATRDAWARDFRMSGLGADATYNAGVIAHWQECYAAALDHSGFCSFSGSALIADGVFGLDDLARAVTGEMDGAGWLKLGAEVCALHRELRGRSLDEEVRLASPELPAAAVRGFAEAVGGARGELSPGSVLDAPGAVPHQESASYAGPVHLRASGLLASKLRAFAGAREVVEPSTGRRFIELDVQVERDGSTVAEVLERVARELPAAARWLLQPGGEPLPAVLIAGRSVASTALQRGGETVELLLVIPGG